MRYPDFLKPGGTIGFVAPAFGCNVEPYRSAFDHALEKFRELGYGTRLGENCYAGAGIGISNTPERCGAELNQMFASPEADVVLSCGGGELMCEVVPYMDFAAIAKGRPKWFMGYSDNTNFTFLSATLADTAAIYGPCAPSFGMEPWHDSLADALALLQGQAHSFRGYPMWELESRKDEEHPCAPYHLTERTRYRLFGDTAGQVEVSGRLLGGCLDILAALKGTRFDRTREFCQTYREDGILWFLEACDLTVFDQRRTLWALREAGWFETASGFLIGRPRLYHQPLMGLDQYSAVVEPLKSLGVPIVMDVDIGHLPPMLPIVTGALAQVRATTETLELDYQHAMRNA